MPPSRYLPSAAADRPGRLRERLLLIGPMLALGLVLAMLWGFVGWFLIVYPDELVNDQRRELTALATSAAKQTEQVLRDAESSLRTIDIALLTRASGDPRNDAALTLLAETLRDTSKRLIDVMLVSRGGAVFRIPSGSGLPFADVADQDFFRLLARPGSEGLAVGLPLRLRDGGPLQLPLAMRLNAPAGELTMALALIDLSGLSRLHADFTRGPSGAVTLARGDGRGLLRTPDLPGFSGRDMFAAAPHQREAFSASAGFFSGVAVATDGIERFVAYQSIPGFGSKVLVSQGQSAALAGYLQQRRVVLLISGAVSALAVAITAVLTRSQRRARLREAQLKATSDASPLGLFRSDMAGRIIYSNETYLRLHGLTADEREAGWLQLLPEAERSEAQAQWCAAVAQGDALNFVRRLRLRDGRQRVLAVRTAPLRVAGVLVGHVGTLEDITAHEAHERAERTLLQILDNTPDSIIQFEPGGQLLYLNPAARRNIGLAPDAPLAGKSYLDYYPRERVQRLQTEILPIARSQGHWQGRSSVMGPDGVEIQVDSTVLTHRDAQNEIETVSAIMRDLTPELAALRQRQRFEAMLTAAAQMAPVMISVLDTAQRFLFFNEAFARRFDASRAAWVGGHVRELLGEADYQLSRPLIEAALAGQPGAIEKRYEHADGPLIVDVHYAPLIPESGEIEGVISYASDVTTERLEAERLSHASQTDPLTGLLNRSGFALRTAEQLANARRQDSLLALFYLDLDHFKPVNDLHGHGAGDALLKAVAGRLLHTLRPQDLAARLGGDEFAVLLSTLSDAGDAARVADKLVQVLGAPFRIERLQLQIGVSIGYCVARGCRADVDAMTALADAKLYEAKRAGRSRFAGTVLDVDGVTQRPAMR
jgi:diguanylate cyclase (GGDEF)-like protein/PAS domain S-box-containing protein